MSKVSRGLFLTAAIGTVTSSVYCCMVVAAAVRFGLRRRREAREPADFLPPLSVLKPLHGTEEGMEQNLRSFFEQDYPEFELLFCARHEQDEGLQLARRVGAHYPQVKARYLTCGEPRPRFHNAKVFSLAKLDAEATFDDYITSDADVRVTPEYLRRMVQNLRDPELGLASCVYLGTAHPGAGLASRLDAVGKSVEMTSGVLVADMIEGTKFALGATMATRRRSFAAVGGFGELGQFYADDFVLGNRLAAQGIGVKLATHVIRLIVLGLLWGVLRGRAGIGLLWLLFTVVNRWLQAASILLVMGDPAWASNTLLYPLRDALGGTLWLGSYLGENFYYRGKVYRLREGGVVELPEDQAETTVALEA